jgi:hypothetical protein
MTVAVHFAATASADALPKITRAFDGLKALLQGFQGYESAELLVNHPQGQVQFLLYFGSLEDSKAFLKKHSAAMMQPFRGMVQNVGGPYFLALEGAIGK